MKPPEHRYLIFVRPVGSLMWTQHMKTKGIPFVSFNEEKAFDVACSIAENERICAHVAKVSLRSETDDILKATSSTVDSTYFLAPKTY